jgi:hypothetical protein
MQSGQMILSNSFADLSEAVWGYFENPIRCAILPDGSNRPARLINRVGSFCGAGYNDVSGIRSLYLLEMA